MPECIHSWEMTIHEQAYWHIKGTRTAFQQASTKVCLSPKFVQNINIPIRMILVGPGLKSFLSMQITSPPAEHLNVVLLPIPAGDLSVPLPHVSIVLAV